MKCSSSSARRGEVPQRGVTSPVIPAKAGTQMEWLWIGF